MEKIKVSCKDRRDVVINKGESIKKTSKKDHNWEKPVLEDVSGRVMAQPYIRFT